MVCWNCCARVAAVLAEANGGLVHRNFRGEKGAVKRGQIYLFK